MSLFRRENNPFKFNLIDIDDAELLRLKKLIEDHGGQVTDDEESIIKFTSRDKYGKKKYVRAKIYDVKFITECVKEKRIVNPEKYRNLYLKYQSKNLEQVIQKMQAEIDE